MSRCPTCGSPLAGDERYCLQCGGRLVPEQPARPPWKVPAVIVAAIVLLAAGGTWFALERVASDAERQAESPVPVVEPPGGAPLPGEVASWPDNSSAFTVVLLSADTEAVARIRATAASNAGVNVGVLDARRYPTLDAGPWVVFAGQFATRPAAEQEAARYAATGFPGAEAAFVSEDPAAAP